MREAVGRRRIGGNRMEPWQMEGVEVARLVKAGTLSAAESVESHLERIHAVNDRLNAIVLHTDDDARATARAIEAGTVTGPLAGAIMTSKINTDHVPYPTTNGIKALKDNMPTRTHPCVQGLLDAGAAMVGRSNSPALAMRLHTDNELHGETLNPFRIDITCGGSSGGAGVAVATGMCHVAQGNDVAGSLRWPAHQNGVIGLRPTIGRIPSGGTNPNPRGWSAANLSTNGPMARTMADLEAAYVAMRRPNWEDPFWIPAGDSFAPPATPTTVAIVRNDGLPIHPAVRDSITRVADALSNAGYNVVETNPPMLETFFGLWKRLAVFDMMIGLLGSLPMVDDAGLTAAWNDWKDSFPPVTGETFLKALFDRDMTMRAWTAFHAEHPVLVTPLMATNTIARAADIARPGAMEEVDEIGRWGINLTTLAVPALAFPTGMHEGAPLGVQISTRAWREDVLLQVGHDLESQLGKVKPVDIAW